MADEMDASIIRSGVRFAPHWYFDQSFSVEGVQMKSTLIGIDLAKNVFKVCALNRAGKVQLNDMAQPSLRAGVTSPTGQRSRPGLGLAMSEPGTAIARPRAAVINPKALQAPRDRRSEAGRSSGQATIEVAAPSLPASGYSAA